MKPPALPKPIVTYVMCECTSAKCKRTPVLSTCDPKALRSLHALRKAAA